MAFTSSLNLRGLALAGALLLAAPVAAKTDLGGCVSSATQNQWGEASMIWYVPGTGEVCAPLDCGGGRAPPKTDVPGCGNYKGTAEYQPSFLPGVGASGSAEATATAKDGASGSAAATAGPDESASPKPTGADMDTTMLTGTRNPPPVTSPATTTTKAASSAAAATQSSETSPGTSAAAPGGSGSANEGESDAADSDAASATSPSAGAGAMPTAAPLGMFIGLVAGAVLF